MSILSKLKYKTLYHGSTKKFDVLRPTAIDFGNLFQKPGWSIFFFKDKKAAEQWAISHMLESILSDKFIEDEDSEGCNIIFDPKSNRVLINKNMVDEFVQSIKKHPNNKCYVYTCNIPRKDVGIGNDSEHDEYTCRICVESFKLDEIHLTPENCTEYVTLVSQDKIINVLRRSRTNLRGFIPSMLMINDFMYQINNNQKFVDKIFFSKILQNQGMI